MRNIKSDRAMDEKQNTEVTGSWSGPNTRIIVIFRVENVNPHLHTPTSLKRKMHDGSARVVMI